MAMPASGLRYVVNVSGHTMTCGRAPSGCGRLAWNHRRNVCVAKRGISRSRATPPARFRTDDSVVEEMLRLKARAKSEQGLMGVFFIDDNFAINVKRTKALLREIIRRDAILPWVAQISMNLLRDEELLDLGPAGEPIRHDQRPFVSLLYFREEHPLAACLGHPILLAGFEPE